MPWSKMSDVPNNIRKLDGVSLTLQQANHIAKVADALTASGNDGAWVIAISQFKKSHSIRDGSWVSGDSEKEDSFAVVEKQTDGSYWITAVSTAALKDREGETFDVQAIDFDIQDAETTGIYPEFRVFHSPLLGIGKVQKMMRVGVFAVDQGASYTDPFSIECCEKMLMNNDGKYRCSRGFSVLEVSGNCHSCGEGLVVRRKHMIAGFNCPTCGAYHNDYRGVLKEVHFRKAKTFDVTITDSPCVPWTGASAVRLTDDTNMEVVMDKKQLKERLLASGISEEVVDERLKSIDETALKQLDGIPFADVLKEFSDNDDDGVRGEAVEQIFVLDPEVLKDFSGIVRDEVHEALNGLELEVPDISLKEMSEFKDLKEEIVALKETVADLTDAVTALLKHDASRIKEIVANSPRDGKLRIQRHKSKSSDMEDEEEDDSEEDPEDGGKKKGKKMPPWLQKSLALKETGDDGVFVGADGKAAKSMTEFIMGRGE